MKFAYKMSVVIAASASLFAFAGCALLCPIGTLSMEPLTPLMQPEQGAGLTAGADIEMTAFVTGWVLAPANILIDQDAPDLPDALQRHQWVPSLAYAVRHPQIGTVIFDAGLRAGACDYGLRPIYWVPCRNRPGQDLVSQLMATDIRAEDIRYIIPSHFHGDHISGLDDLLSYTDAPVIMTSASLSEIKSPTRFMAGIPSSMLASDMRVRVIDADFQDDPVLGDSFDVFGDGSLMVFQTRGHTDGHISALITQIDRSTLLTFDAAHLQANLDLIVPSGAVASADGARNSLVVIRTLSERIPNLRVVYGHEPSQWICDTPQDRTDSVPDTCDWLAMPTAFKIDLESTE